MTGTSRLKIAYVAGSTRTGSTIISSLLGEQSGFFAAGEVYKLWGEGILRGHLCSCGLPVKQCEVWGPALSLPTIGELDRAAQRVDQQIKIVSRTRYLPLSLSLVSFDLGRRLLASRAREAVGILEGLYLRLAESTGSSVVIDSSKFPIYLALLEQFAPIDLYLIHLVRDPRAVAFSWQRRIFDPGRRGTFGRHHRLASSLMWITWNLAIEVMRRRLPGIRGRYMRVRYEDFVKSPEEVLTRLNRFLGDPRDYRFHSGSIASLGTHHSVSGNPVRFRKGRIEVRFDDAWRRDLSREGRLTTALVTWPLLGRYGYSLWPHSGNKNAV